MQSLLGLVLFIFEFYLEFASDCRLLINRELIVDSLRLLIVDSSPWAELFSPHYNAASETTQSYFTLK